MKHRILSFILLFATLLASIAAHAQEKKKDNWLQRSGYGLMFHYEAFVDHTPTSYNQTIDSFDVTRFADAVASTKAGHVIFVIGQHWGKYCAPNKAYEELLGVKNGVWTSKRDLVMEIADALQERKVKLIIYMTARAPMRHYKVIAAMGDTLPSINGKPAGPKVNPMSHPRKVPGFLRSENQAPNPIFLKNWGAVCGEWSKRYGKRISGWWFDGYKTEMRDAYEDLRKEQYNVDTWVQAILSGNPDAELAFNAGAHPTLSLCTKGKLCPHQTFTSGENHAFHEKTKKGFGKLLTPKNFPAPDGVTWHLLMPLSKGWGAGTESKFGLEVLKDRLDAINAEGGAVTFDLPIAPDGAIPAGILKTLRALAKDSQKLKDGKRSF